MKTTTTTAFAMQSSISGGYFLRPGYDRTISRNSDYDDSDEEILSFKTKMEAQQFIDDNELYAMEVVEIETDQN